MDETEALQVIYDSFLGDETIPIKLRLGKGLDRKQLDKAKQALNFLIRAWHGRDMVPQRLAAAFVDIQSTMQWGKDQYSEAEQDEIEDAANELVDLAYDLFESGPER